MSSCRVLVDPISGASAVKRGLPLRRLLVALLAALPLLLAQPVQAETASIDAMQRPAAPLLLAKVAPAGLDPAPYLISEKLDGVRAWWDGQRLRFRSGAPIAAPPWFTARLPAGQPLDGELWLGRGRFEALSGLVRRGEPQDAAWREVRYVVYELPGGDGSFAERAGRLRQIVQTLRSQGFDQLVAAEQFRVRDASELRQRLDAVIAQGGEGLMLHRADAPYQAGRSDVLLKLKPLQDAEAVVIGHLPGQGRHEGRLGALLVRAPDGREFRLGTGLTDAERDRPPALGSTVTYSFQGLTRHGLPRFARYVRLRDDGL